jgi:hypothetical protein
VDAAGVCCWTAIELRGIISLKRVWRKGGKKLKIESKQFKKYFLIRTQKNTAAALDNQYTRAAKALQAKP